MSRFHDLMFTTVGSLWGKSAKALVLGPVRSGKTYFVAGTHRAYTVQEREHFGGPIAMELVPDNQLTGELFTTSNSVLEYGHPGISTTSDTVIYEFTLRITSPATFGHQIYRQKFVIPDGPGGAVFNSRKITESSIFEHIKTSDTLILCIDTKDSASTTAYFHFIQQLSFHRDLHWKTIIFLATKADAIFPTIDECIKANAGREIGRRIGMNQMVQLKKKCDSLVAGWVSFNGFQSNGVRNLRESDQYLEICTAHGYDPAKSEEEWEPFQYLDPILHIAKSNAFGLAEVNPSSIG